MKFLIGGIVFLGVILVSYFSYLLTPFSEAETLHTVVISPGTGINEISNLFKDQSLIRSVAIFKIYSFLSGSAHILKPGTYTFTTGQSIPEIVKRLVGGPPDIEVLVKEGTVLRDIDSELVVLGLIRSGELINFPLDNLKKNYSFLEGVKTLEGFLFPDTYRISASSSAEVIIRKFLDNFLRKGATAFASEALYGKKENWYPDLILASLIEREVPVGEGRPTVAGILKKRLRIGMPLQVDATVSYVKCHGSLDNCPLLTKSDFKIQSVYNTYYSKGLPPAPISNPGLDALLAVRNPETSDFLYYLSDPVTKKTVFSRTFEEHNNNRARYLHL